MPINDGSIIVSIKAGDTSDIERKISELQRKLRSLRETGPGGTYSQLADVYRSRGDEQRAQQIENYRRTQERAGKRELQADLRNQNKELKEIEQRQKNIQSIIDRGNASQERAVKAAENLKRIKQEHLDISKQIVDTETQLAQIQQAQYKQDFRNALGKGDFRGMFDAMKKMGPAAVLNLAGTAAAAAGGAVGGAMQTYGNFRYMQAQLPARQAGREANIAQSTTQLRGRAINEQSAEDILFAPERAKAIGETADFFQQANEARKTRATGKAVVAGAGMLGAGVIGAMTGSALGPIGTVLGGVGGAALAGLGFGQDEETYYGLTGNTQALQQMTAEDATKKYETFKIKSRLQDPTKYYQKKFLSDNRERLLAIQRSAGMSDEGMFGQGGFLQRGGDQFLASERMGMQQQIVGAGGGGASSALLNVTALQAQRSFGLTNSGQAMGRLANYMNAQESEQAFVRVLAKGVSEGMSDTEVLKDYLDQVTTIAQSIGGNEDFVRNMLGAGMGDNMTRRGLQFSAEGFKNLADKLSAGQGPTAAARNRLIGENKEMFGNIKGLDRVRFQNLDIRDIDPESREFKGFYRLAGGNEKFGEGGIEKFAEETRKTFAKAMFLPYRHTKEGKRAIKLLEMDPDKMSEEDKQDLTRYYNMFQPEKIRSRVGEAEAGGLQSIIGGISEKEKQRQAEMEGLVKRRNAGIPLTEEQEKMIGGMGRGAERMGEQTKAGMAKTQNEAFQDIGNTVNELVENMSKNIQQTIADKVTMEEFNRVLKEGGKEAVAIFIEELKKVNQTNQEKDNTDNTNKNEQPKYQDGNKKKINIKPKKR